MQEVLRTNDSVLINFVEALFRDQEIDYLLLDTNMSVLEGSIGILPRRVMVTAECAAQARRLLADAGLAAELSSHRDASGHEK